MARFVVRTRLHAHKDVAGVEGHGVAETRDEGTQQDRQVGMRRVDFMAEPRHEALLAGGGGGGG